MTPDQFKKIMPLANAGVWFAPFIKAMGEFEITTPADQAAFAATVAVESAQLTRTEENLNYSAQGLATTWPRRYADDNGEPNELAVRLAHDREAIANNVYANRMGNGGEQSGDGWRYRGAGPIEITGKANQLEVAAAFGVDPRTVGDWLRTPVGGCRAAARFWYINGCSRYANANDFDGVCDLVNIGKKTARIGDSIGYAARLNFFKIARTAMGV